jgi:hypothetical protein
VVSQPLSNSSIVDVVSVWNFQNLFNKFVIIYREFAIWCRNDASADFKEFGIDGNVESLHELIFRHMALLFDHLINVGKAHFWLGRSELKSFEQLND